MWNKPRALRRSVGWGEKRSMGAGGIALDAFRTAEAIIYACRPLQSSGPLAFSDSILTLMPFGYSRGERDEDRTEGVGGGKHPRPFGDGLAGFSVAGAEAFLGDDLGAE